MAVNFESYKTFYYVAKYRNITHAAKALFQTQPTVSRCISGLEAQLGCRLFVRSKKGVSLTPEAQLLYRHISAACEEIFLAEQQLARQKNLKEGLVRIGASEMSLHHCLLPFLGEFREQYPEIRLRISGYHTPAALEALKKGEIDFAVLISPFPQSGEYRVTKLLDFSDIAVAGSEFAKTIPPEIRLSELSDYPLICLQQGTGSRQYLDDFFERHGELLYPDIELPTTDLIVPVVRQNLGIGIVPENFALQDLQQKTIVRVKLAVDLPKRQICAVSHPAHPLSFASERFLKLLTEEMDGKQLSEQ